MTPELRAKVRQYTRGELIHVMSLEFVGFDKFDRTKSVWPQLYRAMADLEAGLSYAQAHGQVYAGTAVMRALLDHQRAFFRHKKPRVTKRDLEHAVSWSNLDCGPGEGRWIPKDALLVVKK